MRPGLQATAESRMAEQSACFKTDNYAPLAQLPPGLIASDVDFGPFLLALTPHSVLAAPYHRLSTGIVAAHQAFAAPPDEARALLERSHVTYLVTCGSRPPLTLEPDRTGREPVEAPAARCLAGLARAGAANARAAARRVSDQAVIGPTRLTAS